MQSQQRRNLSQPRSHSFFIAAFAKRGFHAPANRLPLALRHAGVDTAISDLFFNLDFSDGDAAILPLFG